MTSGERRMICRSLRSSQRISEGASRLPMYLVPVLGQEADECGLEVGAAGLGVGRRGGGVELGDGAVEEALAVGDDEDSPAVALGLGDVVGGEDDGGSAPGQAKDELPEAGALARVEAGGRLVEEEDRGIGSRPIAMLIRCWLPPESVPT